MLKYKDLTPLDILLWVLKFIVFSFEEAGIEEQIKVFEVFPCYQEDSGTAQH